MDVNQVGCKRYDPFTLKDGLLEELVVVGLVERGADAGIKQKQLELVPDFGGRRAS